MPTPEEIRRRFLERAPDVEPGEPTRDEIEQRFRALDGRKPREVLTTPQDEAADTLITQDNEQKMPAGAADEILLTLQKRTRGVFATQPERNQQLREYADTLKSVGINADFAADPKFGRKIQAEGAVAAKRFLENTKVGGVPLIDVEGEGTEEAKSRVLNAFTLVALIKNSPVVGKAARRVHAAAVRNLLQRQMDRILSQSRPSGTISFGPQGTTDDESALNEQNQQAALFQVAMRADDDTLFKVGQLAAMIDPSDPKSPTAELRQEVPDALTETSPLFRSLFEIVTRHGIETEASRIREGVNDLGKAPSSKRGRDVMAAVAALLGSSWTEQLRDATAQARTNYNLGQLGLDRSSAGPGFTEDGVGFVDVLAGDAMALLATQAAATLSKQGPTKGFSLSRPEKREVERIIEQNKSAAEILEEAEKLGPKNRTDMARALIAAEATDMAGMRARAEAFGAEEIQEGLTPQEKEYMGGLNVLFFELMDRGQHYWESYIRGLKRQDIATNRAFEKLTGVAFDKNYSYALTNSDELTDATEGFFGAWAASGMINRQNGDLPIIGGLRRWFEVAAQLLKMDPTSTVSANPKLRALLERQRVRVGNFAADDDGTVDIGKIRVGVLQNHPMFKGLSSDAAGALMRDDVDVMKMHATQREFAKKNRDEIMGRLLTYQRNAREGKPQSQNVLSHWWDVIKMGLHMAGDMAYETSRIVSEAPEEAAAMLMIEVPSNIGINAARRFAVDKADLLAGRVFGSLTGDTVRGKRLSQYLHANKIDQASQRLSYTNPTMAKRFHEKITDMHAKAVRAGDMEDHADALAAAATAAKRAADEVELTGALTSNDKIRDFGKKVADIYDDLSADPGDIQNWLDHINAATRGGVFRDLARRAGRVFGVGGRGNIRDQVFDQRSFDEVLEGLDEMIHSGTEVEELYVAMKDLADQSGRKVNDLTPEEITPLLPKQINDVVALVDQAHKIPMEILLRDRMAAGLTRLRGATEANKIADFVNEVEDVVDLVATRALDSHLQKVSWHQARKRVDRTLRHVRDRRETELALAEEEFRMELLDADEAAIPAIEAKWDRKINEIQERIGAIDATFKRMREHDPDLPFDARGLGPFTEPVRGGTLLTDNDIEMLVTEAPELFNLVPSDVFKYRVVGKGKKRDFDAINTRIANKEKQIERARKAVDADVRQRIPADPEDPEGRVEVVSRPPSMSEIEVRRGQLAKLENQLQKLRDQANIVKNGRRERISVDRQAFFDALQHKGLNDLAAQRKKSLVDARNAIASSSAQELGSNPFLPGRLPLRQSLKWVREAIYALAARIDSAVLRMQLYMTQYDLMSPLERQLADQIVRDVKGKALTMRQVQARVSGLVSSYPALKAVFDDPSSRGLLADWAVGIDDNLGNLYTLMEQKGVDKGLIKSWQDKGYDPNMWGVFERAGLIKGPQAGELRTLPKRGEQAVEPLLTATGQSLKFQRRFKDWRVTIQEPTGQVEFNFRGEKAGRRPAALNRFLRQRYGKSLKFKQDVEKGVMVATSATGDTVRIGQPLGDMGVAILDPVGTKAERLMIGISRAYKDVGVQQLFEALNVNSNLVIDEDTFGKLQRKYGNRLNKTYVSIPENATLFGNLAGKRVHKRLLADVNKAARAYENLDDLLTGMREIFHREDGKSSVLDFVLGRSIDLAGQTVDTLSSVMKQSLILLSQRVWLGNMVFNVVLDAASGTDLYTSFSGMKSLAWAWRQRRAGQIASELGTAVTKAGRTSPVRLARDPLVQEVIEGGNLDGFFESPGGPGAEQRMLARIMGFEDLDKMEARLADRDALWKKLQKKGIREPNDRQAIRNLERDISALEIQIDELKKGWFKTIGRNMAALLTDQGLLRHVAQDTLGRRGGVVQHRAWAWLRDMYNNIDAVHKLATYHHLRVNKGWGKKEALQHVKDFAQNYRDIPQWLRPTGGKGAFLSLVTSFPYEAVRLFKNLAIKKPQRLTAIMGMIPMLNLAMMTQAGIDIEQYFALMETRGAKSKTDALLALMDTLIIPGPGGSIRTTMDLGLYQAWTNLISNDFSPVAQTVNRLTPDDTELSMLLRIPARFIGNFLLNNPVFSGSVNVVGGVDSTSGVPLWDDKMTAGQKIAAGLKSFAQSVIPPWIHGSRTYNDIEDADNAPINPKTGRPFGAPQKGTVITRQFGVAIKGRGANTAGKVLAPLTPTTFDKGDFLEPENIDFANSENVLVSLIRKAAEDPTDRFRSSAWPTYSIDTELRSWIMKKAQSDDPEVKAQAQAEIDKLIDTNYTKWWKPLSGLDSPTERERFMMEQFIGNDTVEVGMSRLDVDRQMDVLTRMDALGLYTDRRLADMIEQVKFSPLNKRRVSSDPGNVHKAIEILDQHLADNPRASRRLADLRGYLVDEILPRSERLYKRDKRRMEQRLERERRAREARP